MGESMPSFIRECILLNSFKPVNFTALLHAVCTCCQFHKRLSQQAGGHGAGRASRSPRTSSYGEDPRALLPIPDQLNALGLTSIPEDGLSSLGMLPSQLRTSSLAASDPSISYLSLQMSDAMWIGSRTKLFSLMLDRLVPCLLLYLLLQTGACAHTVQKALLLCQPLMIEGLRCKSFLAVAGTRASTVLLTPLPSFA